MTTAFITAILAAAIGCVSGCSGARPIDNGGMDPTQPGVSCRNGDRLDPLRGCVGGVVLEGGTPLSITYTSEMGKAFVLVSLSCLIDEHRVFHDKGVELPATTLGLYEGTIPPGPHELRLSMVVRGKGEGVFSYLKGYQFQVRAAHSFTASGQSPLRIIITGFEKGGIATPLEERPAIRFTDEPWTRPSPTVEPPSPELAAPTTFLPGRTHE